MQLQLVSLFKSQYKEFKKKCFCGSYERAATESLTLS